MKIRKRRIKLCAACGGFLPRNHDGECCCFFPMEDMTRVHVAEYAADGTLIRQYDEVRKPENLSGPAR